MREPSVLIGICRSIKKSLIAYESLSEDQVLLFIDELASVEHQKLADMEAEFRGLCSAIGEVWQYREWEEMSPEQAFLYGSLWGSIKSFESRYQKDKDADQMKLLVPKFKDKLWVFSAIKSQPGILHKELAVKGKISPSRLSQIMDDEDMNDLISHRLSGREKYYFLKPRGEELLGKLKSGVRNVLGSYTEPCKAISMDNDGDTLPKYKGMGDMTTILNRNFAELAAWMLSPREEIVNVLYENNSLTPKTMMGVNKWIQPQPYKEIQKSRYLENGLEMSLVG